MSRPDEHNPQFRQLQERRYLYERILQLCQEQFLKSLRRKGLLGLLSQQIPTVLTHDVAQQRKGGRRAKVVFCLHHDPTSVHSMRNFLRNYSFLYRVLSVPGCSPAPCCSGSEPTTDGRRGLSLVRPCYLARPWGPARPQGPARPSGLARPCCPCGPDHPQRPLRSFPSSLGLCPLYCPCPPGNRRIFIYS